MWCWQRGEEVAFSEPLWYFTMHGFQVDEEVWYLARCNMERQDGMWLRTAHSWSIVWSGLAIGRSYIFF